HVTGVHTCALPISDRQSLDEAGVKFILNPYYEFAGPSLLLEPPRLFDGELIVGIENELHARFVERLAVRGDLHPRLGVRDALDAHGYSHKRRRHDATLYVASGESRFGERKANLRSTTWRRGVATTPRCTL